MNVPTASPGKRGYDVVTIVTVTGAGPVSRAGGISRQWRPSGDVSRRRYIVQCVPTTASMTIRRVVVCEAQVPFVRGGAEYQVRSLIDALRERGLETELVAVPFKWYPKAELL